MKIIAYCLDWHLSKSDAFKDLIAEPLKGVVDVEFVGWDGEDLQLPEDTNIPLMFCMLPPPSKVLKGTKRRLFWVPMWDQAQGYSDDWWSSLPKKLRVITFSDQPYAKATAVGLKTLNIRYFKNPQLFQEATWNQGKILYYWNRVGMASPEFITKLCNSLKVETLLFKPDIDPRIEQNKHYSLPAKIGNNTAVKILHATETREEFMLQIKDANIVLAPRLTEGVGMVFLEAMARGACVIAHDAPTMNEYIEHADNGILFSKEPAIKQGIVSKLKRITVEHDYAPYLVSDKQPWKQLARLQPETLGARALQTSHDGYKTWTKSIQDLIDFVTE